MAYAATDGSGRFLLTASYGGSRIAVSPIAGAAVGAPVQVVATPPKAHAILADPANRFVLVACLGGDAVLTFPFDAQNGRLGTPVSTAIRVGAGPRHMRFARDGALLYVINELDGTLDVFARVPATGALTHLQTVTLVADEPPARRAAADLRITPDERFLYATERLTSSIAAYAIGVDGRLAARGRVPTEAVPRGIALDPAGKFLFAAGLDTGRVATFSVGHDGRLRLAATAAAGPGANWIECVETA